MDSEAVYMPTLSQGPELTAWILSQRPSRSAVNPLEPNGFFLEEELSGSGRVVSSGGILLTNRECPWRCLMCDLWKHTLPYSVPPGAIPKQIDYALAAFHHQPEQVKLYNSGSFFDLAAIPAQDYQPIADRVAFAERVIVESHPRLIGDQALRFRDLLSGSLEVAMGLETIHPDVLPRLNKRVTLDQFAKAAAYLKGNGIGVRAFVLINPPFLKGVEAVEWAVRSANFAFSSGVDVVSLIPTRPGNGALEQLQKSGDFTPPSIAFLERALESSLQLRAGRVFADTWDLDRFSSCPACFRRRADRLASINLTQTVSAPAYCPHCGGQ